MEIVPDYCKSSFSVIAARMKLLTKLIIDLILVQSLLCNICILLFSLGMSNEDKVAKLLEWINCGF